MILALLIGVAIVLVRLSLRAPSDVVARRANISIGLLVVDAIAFFGSAAALFSSSINTDGMDSLIAAGLIVTGLIALSLALTTTMVAVLVLLLVIKKSSSLCRKEMLLLIVTSALFAYAVIPATVVGAVTERIWVTLCIGLAALGALVMTWAGARNTLAAHGASRSGLKAVGFIGAVAVGAVALLIAELVVGIASYSLLLA